MKRECLEMESEILSLVSTPQFMDEKRNQELYIYIGNMCVVYLPMHVHGTLGHE